MILKPYQEKNIEKLRREIVDQLDATGTRRKIVFQAPTGAGKTVMATEVMARLHTGLQDEDCQYRKVAFIWLAPNALHIQSYLKMKSAFSESRILEPVVYDDLDLSADGCIEPGQVFFVNWQSINKKTNVMVRGSEQTPSIYDIIENTRRRNIAIVCIIDEEHMFAGVNAKKSELVLQQINPKVEVRISATPVTNNADAKISIARADVISSGMIKHTVSLNPAIRKALDNNDDSEKLNAVLLRQALLKRQQIADEYKAQGININPLLLIQLPNDDTETMSREEDDLKANLLAQLQDRYDISRENGKLAVWLAGEKTHLDGIEAHTSLVDVLLFKQAIALGWDCPRAAVLLIFRRLSSFTFTIQTVGRIMRMPQQRFYGSQLLDVGYVYTDLSADMIRVEPDDAHYINTLHSYQRKDLHNITLTSDKEERTNKQNNILRADFRKLFKKRMAEEWLKTNEPKLDLFADEEEKDLNVYSMDTIHADYRRKAAATQNIRFDVARIQIEIPTDMEIWDEARDYKIDNKTGYARTTDELQQVFDKFCGSMLSGWSKSKALPMLENVLLDTLELYFNLPEWDAVKVVLYHGNQSKFRDFITRTLHYYRENMLEKRSAASLGFVSYPWSVPVERLYSDSTYHQREDVCNHALQPFYEANDVFNPEKQFTGFLEQNSRYIDWWYKNADSGSDAFAVRYPHTDGREHLFYVDYVIRMKNGTICLFDTKSAGGDQETVHKHNALLEYIRREKEKTGTEIVGGIIIADNGCWKYSPLPIENAKDLAGWNTFFPDQYN